MVQNCSKSYIALYIKVYETRGNIGRLRNTFDVVLRLLWRLKKGRLQVLKAKSDIKQSTCSDASQMVTAHVC